MKRDDAIKLAVDFLGHDRHRHGKCLSAEIASGYDEPTWEIEFAYEGLNERSETTDPPSIVIAVDFNGNNVRLATLM
jgi:hypothetical protein